MIFQWSTRRWIGIVAVLLTVCALVLTGCSLDEGNASSEGDSTNQKRIASVGLGDSDTLLALGIQPVLIAPWGAEGDVAESGVGPWSEELIKGERPAKVFNTASGFTSEVLEKIIASDPDQIIAVNQAVDSQAKRSLEDIAPTTVKPEGTKSWQIPWQDQVKQIANAVGKEDEGNQLIKDTQKVFDDFVIQHPEIKGKKAAVVMPYDGKIGLYTSGDGRGQFIENLGFEIPAELEGDKGEFYRDFAPENYDQLNSVDYLFILDYKGAADALRKDPSFNRTDVMRENKVRWLSEDVGNAMSMPNPVTIPWAVNEFRTAL